MIHIINVVFMLFLFDQIRDKYLSVEDNIKGRCRRFHAMKTEWGFSQLIPLTTFNDPLNGKIKLYPNGYGAQKNKAVSLFLFMDVSSALMSGDKVYAKYTLRIRNQKVGTHLEATYTSWFSAGGSGYPKFIDLGCVNEPGKGYLVYDRCVIEAEELNLNMY
ncbi:hypothetical protein GIB67_024541 [Kingdonia uniflora]|uniref:MATH domain-containing protein n=1 Tax=Kingdonia uniflora TaxID=39325 RepID=A0A7J7LP85_9MAGN|nr:hypothetical protein GIB67_024541 [Kingdonia uniflora]